MVAPPPPPPAVTGDEKVNGEGEKDARVVMKEAEPYVVESNGGVSESTPSFVEVKATQA